jgi:hypothetical protein
MRVFYDELVFDDRDPEDLFAGNNLPEPSYADILKRWVIGDRLTDYERKVTASILIFYPEYIVINGKAKEFIELIKEHLNQPELQNPLNPERGLFLYTQFFLTLKQGIKEDALRVLEILEIFFALLSNISRSTGNYSQSTSETDFIKESDISGFSKLPPDLENAYIEILILIMDCHEILFLKPGFNISQLPGLPVKKLSGFEGTNFRGQALEFYYNKEYDKASAIYWKMLINKFETPGTSIHLARLEMICGNMDKAGIFIVNAWRSRNEAPAYVLVRILYFIILINMVKLKPFYKWFGCIKHVLSLPDSKMQWDMDRVLAVHERNFQPQQIELLETLLAVLSGTSQEEYLDKIEAWQKALPIPFEKWPDFDIAFFLS